MTSAASERPPSEARKEPTRDGHRLTCRRLSSVAYPRRRSGAPRSAVSASAEALLHQALICHIISMTEIGVKHGRRRATTARATPGDGRIWRLSTPHPCAVEPARGFVPRRSALNTAGRGVARSCDNLRRSVMRDEPNRGPSVTEQLRSTTRRHAQLPPTS